MGTIRNRVNGGFSGTVETTSGSSVEGLPRTSRKAEKPVPQAGFSRRCISALLKFSEIRFTFVKEVTENQRHTINCDKFELRIHNVMKTIYLILLTLCFSIKSFGQDRKLPVVPASKLATITIPAGTSKISAAALPEKIQLAHRATPPLYSIFTKTGARGDYYKIGNSIIRVEGVEKVLADDQLQKMSKERFLEGSPMEHRQYDVINRNKVLFIQTETDINYGYILVYIQNPSTSNFLKLNVLYPMSEKKNIIPDVSSFIRSIRFK